MKIKLIFVGKTDVGYVKKGMDDFLGRLKHYIVVEVIELPPVKALKSLPIDQLKEKEGSKILSNINPGELLVLLDEYGKQFTSREFAAIIEKNRLQSTRSMVFVVGGAFGFSEKVYQAAGFKMSLSKMTFPHQLVRLIFLEQLYRALTITRNEKYHHD